MENIIKLLSYCIHREEKLIVYELMEDISLIAFTVKKQRPQLLTWPVQFAIIKEITRGVVCVHQDSRLSIVHSNLKVGPGEVDDDLEGKVAESVLILFERAEQATKALIELEGRLFGGRLVRACFYDEERFSNNELAPLPGEVPSFF
ncbi:cysteine-rich receptor-like protein kinase 5 [Striga asiatica]|uniref:Cysteine-rich receptor-like protein kinase 5 n=1 Tax=Striga asiatica TaxID=4170 RepID=A0A5A7PUP7_STRAF|nr:cysteine-rich receptor-like protein kinase 5 [Striga asiatica]